MRRLRFIGGVLLAVLGVTTLRAQQPTGTIRGRVTDAASQSALPGVTVTFGSRSSVTNADGRYVIANVAAGSDSLRARMLGYSPAARQVFVTAGQSVDADFGLTAQAVSLSEIVVVGYGQQRAGNVTGAITAVSDSQFNTGRVVSPQMLIQSKVAGVQVIDNNDPGGGLSLRIRGGTSVSASSEPLYVVDGVPLSTGAGGGLSAGRDPLNFINPNDIANITVLRDASAAAIYGSNAANGVVLITTKSGRTGTSVEYSSSFSTSSVTRLPSMLNATQFRAAVMQYGAASQQAQLLSANTDWFGAVDRTAWGQEHNLSVSGSGGTMNYRVSLGYLNQDGIIRGSNTQRVSVGINYSQSLFGDRLNIRTNVRGSRALDHFTPGGVLSNAAQMGPTQPILDTAQSSGYYNWGPPFNQLQSPDNPVEILAGGSDIGTTYRSLGNMTAEWRVPWIEGLRANVNLGYDIARTSRNTFTPSTLHGELKAGHGGQITLADRSELNTVLETYLNWTLPRNMGPGILDLTGGYSYSQSNGSYPFTQATKLGTNLLGDNGLAGAQFLNVYPNPQASRLISFFGRANYNIGDRYLAAFTIRRDGSSRFGPDNAWGTFPSVAVAWRLSSERFFPHMFNLSDLKLRASWARTGNQSFANYQQYSVYQYGDGQSQAQFGSTFVQTIRPSAYTPGIRWEATSSTNFGIDYGFSNQRFSGAIDYYVKNTSDLLFDVPTCAGCNLSNHAIQNIGSMRNKGLELSLNARLRNGGRNRLGWSADFTASHNTNELTAINPFSSASQQILVGGIAGGVGSTVEVLMPGQPVNSFFTCRQSYDAAGKPVENKYLNANDSVVTGCIGDRRVAHDPAPKWVLGHSSYLTYGNFDMSFTLRSYIGNYVYNNVASNLGTYSEVTRSSPYNLHASVLETGFTTPQYLSDYYVENASFLRMDNITVGYSFNYRGQPARAYLTMQNAFTITGYSGVDPTAGLNGIDNNIYPRARTVTGGLSVRF